MSTIDGFQDLLLEGHSLNMAGLSGSGRSATIRSLERSLREETGVWSVVVWTTHDLQTLSRKEKVGSVERLQDSGLIPVLVLDDFGDHLVQADGKWLEQLLFAKMNDAPSDGREYLRCVVVTHPRDKEIQVPGSGLRERCKVVYPERGYVAPEIRGRFGFATDDELLRFCGGTHILAPGSASTGASERGIAMRRAREAATLWVGELGPEHHARLTDIMSRPASEPSRWRHGEVDECLVPAVAEVDGQHVNHCHLIDAIQPNDLRELLLSERWPNQNQPPSVRRFVARCGNEPHPRWIDNFLADMASLRLDLLVAFLSKLLATWTDGRTLEVLARNYVGGVVVYPADVGSALRSAGLTPEDERRLDWRMYDQRSASNLHNRQLLLPGRTVAFDLPPATVVIGQYPVGNESDSESTVRDHQAVRDAWATARRIW